MLLFLSSFLSPRRFVCVYDACRLVDSCLSPLSSRSCVLVFNLTNFTEIYFHPLSIAPHPLSDNSFTYLPIESCNPPSHSFILVFCFCIDLIHLISPSFHVRLSTFVFVPHWIYQAGHSPLGLAAAHGHGDLVAPLLERGADVTWRHPQVRAMGLCLYNLPANILMLCF